MQVRFVLRIIYLITIAIALAGCLTPRKAEKRLAAIDKKFPDKTAAHCINHYPCKEGEVIIDTVYEVHDSIIEIPCEIIDTIHNIRIDTVIKRVVSVKKAIEYKTQRIYTDRYITDSAKIKLLIALREKDKAESDKVIKKKGKLLNILSGALISLLLLTLLLILILSRKR